MASDKIANLTEADFDSTIKSATTPVLVDFWAEWCGPCKMLAPVLGEIADEKEGSLQVVKVNVDNAPTLAERFSVRAIPTILIFKNGEIASQVVGMTSKKDLLAKVDALA